MFSPARPADGLWLAALFGALGACSAGRPAGSPARVDPDSLRSLVWALGHDSLEGRGAGYRGEEKAAALIAERFRALGLEPGRPGGGYLDTFRFQPRSPIEPWEILTSRNVVAFLPGDDPAVRDQIVVVGAHYDGQGMAGQADPGRLLPAATLADSIWNSADDNATGAATVVELARVITSGKVRHRRSLTFAAFGAEEPSLSGSIAYVNRPPRPWSRHVAMVNLEKLGRETDKPLVQASSGTGSSWKRLLGRVDSIRGFRVEPLLDELIYDTDHYPFAARGVPAVVFGVIHEVDGHLPTDQPDRIDRAALAKRAAYVLSYVLELVNGDDVPRWIDVNHFDPGVEVAPPTPAELTARGFEWDTRAFKVLDVIDSLPGAKAGLVPGDLIVRVDDGRFDLGKEGKNPLKDAAVAAKGPTLPVEVVRGGRRVRLELGIVRPAGA